MFWSPVLSPDQDVVVPFVTSGAQLYPLAVCFFSPTARRFVTMAVYPYPRLAVAVHSRYLDFTVDLDPRVVTRVLVEDV
jgi:hypothetical protein